MKFNIYYGVGDDFTKQELINSFDTNRVFSKTKNLIKGELNDKHEFWEDCNNKISRST